MSEPAFARAVFDRVAFGHYVRPYWRRLTAFFSLGLVVILTGLAIAAVVGLSILLVLFVIERAIA